MNSFRDRWQALRSRQVMGLTIINIILAATAFGKDVAFAVYFGTTAYADALTLAFFIPDAIGNNLLAWAIGVACVPVFSALYTRGEFERLRYCFRKVMLHMLAGSAAICLCLYLFKRELLRLLVPGFEQYAFELCLALFALLLPTLLLFPIVMIASALLQAMKSFYAPAWAPVAFNGIFLLAVAFLAGSGISLATGSYVVAVFLLIGVLAMTGVVLLPFYRDGSKLGLLSVRKSGRVGGNEAGLKQIYRRFVPYLLILLGTQAVYVLERSLASSLDEGTIAALTYAFRLSQFPNWVFISAITTVLLPVMSKALAEQKHHELRTVVAQAIKTALLITVPLSAFLYAAREPVISLLFVHGSFDEHSLAVTADIFAGYALTIVTQSLSAICLRYYLAVGKMRVPLAVYAVSMLANAALDYWLVSRIGAAGLGYGAACGAALNAALLIICLLQDLKNREKGVAHESFSDYHPLI